MFTSLFNRVAARLSHTFDQVTDAIQDAVASDRPEPPIRLVLREGVSAQGDTHTLEIDIVGSASTQGMDRQSLDVLVLAVHLALGGVMPELRPTIAGLGVQPGVLGTVSLHGTSEQIDECQRVVRALSKLAKVAADLGAPETAAGRLCDLLRDPSVLRCLLNRLVTVSIPLLEASGQEGTYRLVWDCRAGLTKQEAMQLVDMATALFVELKPAELGAESGMKLLCTALGGKQSAEVKRLLFDRLFHACKNAQPGTSSHLGLFKAVGQTLCGMLTDPAFSPDQMKEWESLLDRHIEGFLESGEFALLEIGREMLSTKVLLRLAGQQEPNVLSRVYLINLVDEQEGVTCDEETAQYIVAMHELCMLPLKSDDPELLVISAQLDSTGAWLRELLAKFDGETAAAALRKCNDQVASKAASGVAGNARSLLDKSGFEFEFKRPVRGALVLVPNQGCQFDAKAHAQLLIDCAKAYECDLGKEPQCDAVMRYLAEHEELLTPDQRRLVFGWLTTHVTTSDAHLELWQMLFKSEQGRWETGQQPDAAELQSFAIGQLALACRTLAARDPSAAEALLDLFPQDDNYRPLRLATHLHMLSHRPTALRDAWPALVAEAYEALQLADQMVMAGGASGAALHIDAPPAQGSLAHPALLWRELCSAMALLTHRYGPFDEDFVPLAGLAKLWAADFMQNLIHADPAARDRIVIALVHAFQGQRKVIPALLVARLPLLLEPIPDMQATALWPLRITDFGMQMNRLPVEAQTTVKCCQMLCRWGLSAHALAEPGIVALLGDLIDDCFTQDLKGFAADAVIVLVANAGSIVICSGPRDIAGSRRCKYLIELIESRIDQMLGGIPSWRVMTAGPNLQPLAEAAFALKANPTTTNDGLPALVRDWGRNRLFDLLLTSAVYHHQLMRAGTWLSDPDSKVAKRWETLESAPEPGIPAIAEVFTDLRVTYGFCAELCDSSNDRIRPEIRPYITRLINLLLTSLVSPFFIDGTQKNAETARHHLLLATYLRSLFRHCFEPGKDFL